MGLKEKIHRLSFKTARQSLTPTLKLRRAGDIKDGGDRTQIDSEAYMKINACKKKSLILRALVTLGPIFLISNIFCYWENYSNEKIVKFESFIKIEKDGSLNVTEKITVNAMGAQIKRGIVREFPTKYKDKFNNNYNVKFELKSVLKNGNKEQYKIERRNNGVYIYIGNPDIYLTPGIYSYEINYRTNRQLGYFEKFDELYWNVTGNGWRLPIEKAEATVILPDNNIPSEKIKFEAYTGYFGEKGQDYGAKIADPSQASLKASPGELILNSSGISLGTSGETKSSNILSNKIIFKTTKRLDPGEGLTIVATWPKGYVTQPSFIQKIIWLLVDNLNIIIALLGLFLVFILGLIWVIDFRKSQDYKTVIPLFQPPNNLSAGAVRYIYRKKYDSKSFAALIVELAVAGYLKIKFEPGWFSGAYTLVKVKDLEENKYKSQEYYRIFRRLFRNSNSIKISKSQSEYLSTTVNIYQEILYKNYSLDYFENNTGKTAPLWAITISTYLISLFINLEGVLIPFIIGIINMCLCSIFGHLLRGYTQDGIKTMQEIMGFKLFLQTTEEDRLKVIGTPPTKNPELYEKYLPYAIALGVEKEWAKKFAPIFEQLKKQDHEYNPVWYSGLPAGVIFPADSFSSNLSSSLSSQISSSTSSPGSSSGSGGGGSSGGGGGGGGGGGW